MKEKKFVSIIMLCFNGASFMERSLLAIKNQTFKDFELVFVDNGSSDNTYEKINEFKENNPDIFVNIIRLSENNLLTAWDRAVEQAEGIYILKHDVDDWMESNCLSLLVQAAKDEDADIAAGCYANVTENKVLRKRKFTKHPTKWSLVEQQGVMYRKELIVGWSCGVEHMMFGDLYNMVSWCSMTSKIAFVNEYIYNYLTSPLSNFNSKKMNSIGMSTAIVDFYHEIYEKEEKEKNQVQYACVKKVYDIINVSFKVNRDFRFKDLLEMIKYLNDRFPNYKKSKWTNSSYTVRTNIMFIMCRFVDTLNLWKHLFLIRKRSL